MLLCLSGALLSAASCEVSIIEKDVHTCRVLFCIGDNATMRTLPTIGIVHPFFNDRLQLCSQVGDMERFLPYDGRLNMNRVRAIPTKAI